MGFSRIRFWQEDWQARRERGSEVGKGASHVPGDSAWWDDEVGEVSVEGGGVG